MTLLWMDGFDAQIPLASKGYVEVAGAAGGPATFSTATRFGSGACLKEIYYNHTVTVGVPSSPTLVVGVSFNINNLSNILASSGFVFQLGSPSVVNQISVRATATGGFAVYNGTSSLRGSTAGGLFLAGQWNYLEAKVTFGDALAGSVVLRLNGVEILNLTGIDTNNGGGSDTGYSTVSLLGPSGNSSDFTLYDDFYVLDINGSVNNDFLGDCTIRVLPVNGNGASSQFVGSDGNSTDNYLLVDEIPANAADYVQSGTSGARDTYTVTDLPANVTTVKAVQVLAVAGKDDSGSISARTVLTAGGSTAVGPTTGLPSSISGLLSSIHEVQPNASTWTPAAVNGIEVGFEVV